jgi:NAD(P)-dependent dehydrogenase (short-subunit alcohol dehydrogenase family)
LITDYSQSAILDGRVAFITGGGSGINLEIGKSLARLGADIAICGRSQERLDAGRRELEDVGAVAAFLATPLASYISGARIMVDGGQNLTGSYVFNRAMAQVLNASTSLPNSGKP